MSDLISYLQQLQWMFGGDLPVSTDVRERVMPWFIANNLMLVINPGPSSA
ncbi:hypothetical protein SAMN02745121_07452 [Nannocystis exedens]|uniref:Uncharacterized protein n=1 Tax=Nannocystis exedens TaxID=54 RepID=A0A1I2GR57_9BACT|nr:hypothetical protein [Nannocystis exedens]PCC68755.1 hypothetical protein NAEX_01772 [Nannocystis exedens]SFF19723.1 hypothetical protein SAMN02745121_07452 [Nannocystis exedens]